MRLRWAPRRGWIEGFDVIVNIYVTRGLSCRELCLSPVWAGLPNVLELQLFFLPFFFLCVRLSIYQAALGCFSDRELFISIPFLPPSRTPSRETRTKWVENAPPLDSTQKKTHLGTPRYLKLISRVSRIFAKKRSASTFSSVRGDLHKNTLCLTAHWVPLEFLSMEKFDPFLQKRREILKSIPRFWSVALSNHPNVSMYTAHQQDQIALNYLEDIWLARDAKEKRCFTLEFVRRLAFSRNPSRGAHKQSCSTSRRTRSSPTPC